MDNYKVLKLRYKFNNNTVSQVTDLLVRNLFVVMKAQAGKNQKNVDNTIAQITRQLQLQKYIEIKLYIQDFDIVITNSFERLASVNDMDSTHDILKPTFAMSGKAIGVTGELTRKMFSGTVRKEYRFDFGIQENGDGRGLFNYLFLSIMGYPMGNLGWKDEVTAGYMANVVANNVSSIFDKVAGLSKATVVGKTLFSGAKTATKYGIYNNHTVFAVPNLDISIQDMFSTGASFDSRFLNIENVMINGFNAQFVSEKVSLIKPTLSDVNVSLKDSTNNFSNTEEMFRFVNGYISFSEKNITNYESFRNNFHGLSNITS